MTTKTYLTVKYQEKDAAKALGARWDAGEQKWFVPEGRDLAPFSQWLPLDLSSVATKRLAISGTSSTGIGSLAMPVKNGVSLSSLLAAGVSKAVSQAYRTGIWVLVEVVELRSSGGHIFMGLSERDAGGTVLAIGGWAAG